MPGSSNTAGAVPGLTLKAWALFTTGGTLIASSGVSGVVRGSAGSYTVTLSAAMPDLYFCCDVRFVGGFNNTAGWSPNSVTQVGITTSTGSTPTDLGFAIYVGVYR